MLSEVLDRASLHSVAVETAASLPLTWGLLFEIPTLFLLRYAFFHYELRNGRPSNFIVIDDHGLPSRGCYTRALGQDASVAREQAAKFGGWNSTRPVCITGVASIS